MNGRTRIGCIVVMFLFLVGFSAAADPDHLLISTSTPWVIAGSSDTARIDVQVFDETNGPVVSIPVTVWCDDLSMGTVLISQERTDISGLLVASFSPGIRSGDVRIYAAIPGTSIVGSTIQRIDHAAPKIWSALRYPVETEVQTVATIIVRMNDSYGNIVDSKHVAEEVTFLASEYPDSGFLTGSTYATSVRVPVGDGGDVVTQYKMGDMAQNIFIQIQAPGTMVPDTQWIQIRGSAGTATRITSLIEPRNGQARANNEDQFLITYSLYDAQGNPAPNRTFWRDTTLGEHDRFITNDEGIAIIPYGPKKST
jgi:hypothetical protein